MAVARADLARLLGLPGTAPPPTEPRFATFLVPDGAGAFPAVLYCHAHGGAYELGRRELTEGAHWLASPPAPDLLAAGFAVLAIDMPGFGDRQDEGSESALAKAGLWRGRPLFGRMVADQLAAFGWLVRQPQIDPARIATLGASMGGALAMWAAALEPRIAACVQLCMLADIAPLIETGAHDRHGLYLCVPGLVAHAETGDIAGLVAPRPHFIGHGAQDTLTPAAARDAALARVRAAYGETPMIETYLSPDTGHIETPDMRRAVLDFLTRTLAPTQTETRETC